MLHIFSVQFIHKKLLFLANTTEEDANDSEYVDITEGERYKLETHDNLENSKFIIPFALKSDRGSYKCTGLNDVMIIRSNANDQEHEDEGKNESVSVLRIKDKLAALWPFLGICAEVFVLCTIILIYEKRRNKTDLDER